MCYFLNAQIEILTIFTSENGLYLSSPYAFLPKWINRINIVIFQLFIFCFQSVYPTIKVLFDTI
jgi:hypothetical protein